MALKEYAGNAPATRLSGTLASGTTSNFTVITGGGAGYPTGSTAPFVVVIDRDSATEEKILVATRSGDTFTGLTRGYDGTSAQAHGAQAVVEHGWDAVSATEASAHTNDDTRDDHSQYLNVARHDLEARHVFGAGLGDPGTPASTGDANSAGTGDDAAREDHVHKGVLANEAMTDWTPTLTQSGALTIAITRAKYQRLGRLIVCSAVIEIDSAGSAGSPIVLGGLPANAAYHASAVASWLPVGNGVYLDSGGVGNVDLMPFFATASTVGFYGSYPGDSVINQLGSSGGLGFAASNSDRIAFTLTYEAAS